MLRIAQYHFLLTRAFTFRLSVKISPFPIRLKFIACTIVHTYDKICSLSCSLYNEVFVIRLSYLTVIQMATNRINIHKLDPNDRVRA